MNDTSSIGTTEYVIVLRNQELFFDVILEKGDYIKVKFYDYFKVSGLIDNIKTGTNLFRSNDY